MAQMWPGVRPSPGADVAWGEAQSRCRCDRDEPSPGADVEWTQSASAVSHSTHALPFALMNCFFSSVARCPQAALNPHQIPYRTRSGQRAPCIGAAAQQLARRACCVGGRKTKASALLLGVPRPHARPQAVAALRGAAHRHDARPPQPAHPTRQSPCIPRVSAHTPQRAAAAEIRSVSSGSYLSPTARAGLACTTAASIAIAILMVSRVMTPTAYLHAMPLAPSPKRAALGGAKKSASARSAALVAPE